MIPVIYSSDLRSMTYKVIYQIESMPQTLRNCDVTACSTRQLSQIEQQHFLFKKLKANLDAYKPSWCQKIVDFILGRYCKYQRLKRNLPGIVNRIHQVYEDVQNERQRRVQEVNPAQPRVRQRSQREKELSLQQALPYAIRTGDTRDIEAILKEGIDLNKGVPPQRKTSWLSTVLNQNGNRISVSIIVGQLLRNGARITPENKSKLIEFYFKDRGQREPWDALNLDGDHRLELLISRGFDINTDGKVAIFLNPHNCRNLIYYGATPKDVSTTCIENAEAIRDEVLQGMNKKRPPEQQLNLTTMTLAERSELAKGCAAIDYFRANWSMDHNHRPPIREGGNEEQLYNRIMAHEHFVRTFITAGITENCEGLDEIIKQDSIDLNAPLMSFDGHNVPPLIYAIKKQQIHLVKWLLTTGANPNVWSTYNIPPIFMAAIYLQENMQPLIDLFKEAGGNVNLVPTGSKPWVLSFYFFWEIRHALKSGIIKPDTIIRNLVECGLNKFNPNFTFEFFIHTEPERNILIEVCKALIYYGYDVSDQEVSKFEPLQKALELRNQEFDLLMQEDLPKDDFIGQFLPNDSPGPNDPRGIVIGYKPVAPSDLSPEMRKKLAARCYAKDKTQELVVAESSPSTMHEEETSSPNLEDELDAVLTS